MALGAPKCGVPMNTNLLIFDCGLLAIYCLAASPPMLWAIKLTRLAPVTTKTWSIFCLSCPAVNLLSKRQS